MANEHIDQNERAWIFEIRLESIGGLGANLAGKMLAESGVLGLGLNGANFSSYGSEKKGSPVKSFVRLCEPDVEIHDHSPIEEPDVIGVFHEALHKTVNVLSGLKPDGIVLVNSTRDFEEIRRDLKFPYGTLAVVDATGIAIDEHTKVNTSMLGALFRICDFLDPDSMREVIRHTFQKNIRTWWSPICVRSTGAIKRCVSRQSRRPKARRECASSGRSRCSATRRKRLAA